MYTLCVIVKKVIRHCVFVATMRKQAAMGPNSVLVHCHISYFKKKTRTNMS